MPAPNIRGGSKSSSPKLFHPMSEEELRKLLNEVQSGRQSIDSAVESLSSFPVLSISGARIDTQRSLRTGIDEVIYAEGKSWTDLKRIVQQVYDAMGRVLITRLTSEQIERISLEFSELDLFPQARIAVKGSQAGKKALGSVAVLSAGTSDRSVALEAALCAKYFGLDVLELPDVGVSCLSRLVSAMAEVDKLDCCAVLIVVAGMEGALPSVLAGLTKLPIIAVPTSVGYGVAAGGSAAAMSMLASCAPGISVVNVDNGFGSAVCAKKIIGRFTHAAEKYCEEFGKK